jgi:hypothetical protein
LDIRDILKRLSPLRNRMHFNRGLICIFASLGIAGIVTMVLAYASLLIPIPYLLRNMLYIFVAFASAGVLISVFSRPGKKALIKTADELGLKERLTTAWQLQGEQSAIARLQREDTFKAVSGTDFKKLYPIRFPVKFALVLAVSLILTLASFMVTGYARGTAAQIEKLQNIVNEQLEKLEKVNEQLKEINALDEAELEKILEETARLEEELKKSKTEDEALKAVSRAESELDRLDSKQQLNKLGEALSGNEMTSELGEAVKNDDITDVKQALEKLMHQLEQEEISPEELAEMLKQASEQMDNSEAAEQLRQAAGQLALGSREAGTNALQNLGDTISGMMQSQGSAGLGQALGQLSQAMQQAKSSISQADSSLSADSQSGAGGQGQGNRSAVQPGRSAGSGQTSGAGMASGQLSNVGGGGAGEGSTNEDSGYTGSEKPGAGRDAGEGREEAFEQLYDPDHLGGDANPSQVSGQRQDGGYSSYSQAEHIPVQKGAILPYDEVLARYSNEAASYMEKTEIPAAMKEIVRKYFESLE